MRSQEKMRSSENIKKSHMQQYNFLLPGYTPHSLYIDVESKSACVHKSSREIKLQYVLKQLDHIFVLYLNTQLYGIDI